MKQVRSNSLADALFSKTKQAVIGILFSDESKELHLRELARLAGVTAATLAKELDILVAAGLLVEQRDGNRRTVRANTESPIFEELKGIAVKTAGVADIVRAALADVRGVDLAFIFGSVARNEAKSNSDVDLCVVGAAKNRDIMTAAAVAERALRRPVNAVLYSPVEFHERMRKGGSFVERIGEGKKIFVVGQQREFDELSESGETGQAQTA
ncbi:nucleotidyltransferase domain-containing protein [Ramlibacter sp.]|uniref:nucleotidyltransferase domain-containing protein n=1 Tax=Ramlibacter sp. TaxID=1917967 RepID=UPI003D0D292B